MDSADVERELRGLAERLRAVEGRLAILEHPDGARLAPAVAPPVIEQPVAWHPALESLGVGLVGLGVGYFLRALVESGTMPAGPGVALGILFAGLWLVAAVRRAESLFAVTSALVLGPLLWEATTRFHVLSPWAAAGTVLVLAGVGFWISRR